MLKIGFFLKMQSVYSTRTSEILYDKHTCSLGLNCKTNQILLHFIACIVTDIQSGLITLIYLTVTVARIIFVVHTSISFS